MILFYSGITITESQLINAYKLLKTESFELGFKKFFIEVNEQIVSLLMEGKGDEALEFVNRKRIELWRNYVKERIDRAEETLKPKHIFSEKIFSEMRKIREEYAAVEKKSKSGSAPRNYKQILDRIEDFNEIAERERQRSAFNFLWKALQWGIVVSLASLTVLFYFMSPTIYVVPIPFVLAIVTALIGYGVVRKYPYISKTTLMIIIQILSTIIVVIVYILSLSSFT